MMIKYPFILLATFGFVGVAQAESEKPVIRLEDIYVEGNLRRPPIVEISGSNLEEKINEAALQNLINLEKKLLKPLDTKILPKNLPPF